MQNNGEGKQVKGSPAMSGALGVAAGNLQSGKRGEKGQEEGLYQSSKPRVRGGSDHLKTSSTRKTAKTESRKRDNIILPPSSFFKRH